MIGKFLYDTLFKRYNIRMERTVIIDLLKCFVFMLVVCYFVLIQRSCEEQKCFRFCFEL